MARQTISIRHAEQDLVNGSKRSLLCSETDREKLCYVYEPQSEEDETSTANRRLSTTQTKRVDSLPTVPTEATTPSLPVVPPIDDIPVSAREVAQALIARKIGVGFSKVDPSKSIKTFSKGKSMMQNELVGILEAEFSTLPSGVEDLPLELLGQSLQPTFSGKPGKQTSAYIAKLVSTKMPAGFNKSAICQHLESSFGIGPGRQVGVLLFALTEEPPSRLSEVSAAKAYFDGTSKCYADFAGITLQKRQAVAGSVNPTPADSSSEHAGVLENSKRAMMLKDLDTLSDQLGVDPYQRKALSEMSSLNDQLKKRLQDWEAEFDGDFFAGIKPSFDSRQQRKYNSWWNNAKQDLIDLFQEVVLGDLLASKATNLQSRLLHLANRWDRSLENISQHQQRLIKDQTIASKIRKILPTSPQDQNKTRPPIFIFSKEPKEPRTEIAADGKVLYLERSRDASYASSYPDLLRKGAPSSGASERLPPVFLKSRQGFEWHIDQTKTETLLDVFSEATLQGISLTGKTILLTGAGKGSIGADVLRALLAAGSRVIVTTSRAPSATAKYYQDLYHEYGSRGSELIILPFNQASKQDCTDLIEYIYSDEGLFTHLDAVIPFAAITDLANLDSIGSHSELAHRMMLTNINRLLGGIIRQKKKLSIVSRPTQVILPMSPNHGDFGGDGLYGESKLGLETLLNRFRSERWSNYLTICGAIIGWTRGTGLMSRQDMVAQFIEAEGTLTFSQDEMAFNIFVLLTDRIASMCENEPLVASLDGGLSQMSSVKSVLSKTHFNIKSEILKKRAIYDEDQRQASFLKSSSVTQKDFLPRKPRSYPHVSSPPLPDFDLNIRPLEELRGTVDLSDVLVIVGFSEIGPWGNSRTRWEMESRGTFSIAGWVEMAWIMNLIKYREEKTANGALEVGWIDSKSGEPVEDADIERKYGPQILEHSGIRFVESDLFDGYDPNRKETLHEIVLESDLPAFEASQSIAEAFRLQHGDKSSIHEGENGEWRVKLHRGATITVPKANAFEGLVAGQIPTGFNPNRYGIPEEIVRQVDPVTSYALCCVAEALYSAGILDSWEIFNHIHLSELGNFVGSMMGGMTKIK